MSAASKSGITLLVADDNPLVRNLIVKGLEGACEVAIAADGADALLRKNLLVWGVGGVILPFIGIKLIDVVLSAMHMVA